MLIMSSGVSRLYETMAFQSKPAVEQETDK